MVRLKIAKLYIYRPGHGGIGPTAVPHGGSYSTAHGCTVATATAVTHGGRGPVCFQNFVIFLFQLGWR
jgi:hypothetical protein